MMRAASLAALLTLALVALPAGGEIYKWKDKDGKVHFSDIPPVGVDVKPAGRQTAPSPSGVSDSPDIESETPDGEGATGSAIPKAAADKSQAERDLEFRQRREAEAKAKQKAAQDTAKAERRAADCERAKIQRAALSSGQRAARPTGDGGRTFLTLEEREAEISRAQELIDAFCDEKN